MLASEMRAVLASVDPPAPGAQYAAVQRPIEAIEAFVGWEDPETAVLIMPSQDGPCPEVRLRYLDVLPAAEVSLRFSGSNTFEVRQAAVMRCRSADSTNRLAFENVAAALCSRLDDEGGLDLSVQIPSLERLFMAFQQEPITTVIGLWAELALLAHSGNVVEAVEAWHLNPRSVFDFRGAGRALEVKASRDAAREHWISLDQWRASEHVECDLASFIVPSLAQGVSIADLLETVTVRLHGKPSLQSKVVEVAARTLGRDFAHTTHERFDLEAAMTSLRFVPFRQVPHGSFEPGVLEARWKTSLEHLAWTKHPSWGALSPAES